MFVCLSVLKLLLGKWIGIVEWYIAGCAIFRAPKLSILEPDMITWKENIPKKLILGLLNFWIFSDVQNAVSFFYNPLFVKTVNYFLKKSRDFFKETFFWCNNRCDDKLINFVNISIRRHVKCWRIWVGKKLNLIAGWYD